MSSARLQQPKGMYVLAFTELFERLSYYTFSFLLVLYAAAPVVKGGLGWKEADALNLMGTYTFAAFSLPILGGFFADRILGVFRAAIMGAVLIVIGHCCMYFSSANSIGYLYLALSLVSLGTAFFKPSMPTLLGLLYGPNDSRRASGFSYYYVGINLGAMIAGILAGVMMSAWGYRIALASAGVTMIIGVVILLIGRKHLVILPPAGLIHTGAPASRHAVKPLSPVLKKALLYLFLAFAFFGVWSFIYNIGISGTLSLYIEEYTDRTILGYTIPTPFFQSLESLGIIIFTPLLTWYLGRRALRGKEVHFFTQMNMALFIISIGIAYLAYISKEAASHIVPGETPFIYYQMIGFILSISLSEIMISPVMMAAISILSPLRFSAIMQAFYLLVIGVTGKLAGYVGGYSLQDPFTVFLTVAAISTVAAVIFYLLRQKMMDIADAAALEQLEEEGEEVRA